MKKKVVLTYMQISRLVPDTGFFVSNWNFLTNVSHFGKGRTIQPVGGDFTEIGPTGNRLTHNDD